MKKSALPIGVPYWQPPYKLLMIMKLTAFMLMIALSPVTAASFAQKLTYEKQGASLAEVFSQIRKQTGYNVLYSPDQVDPQQKVSVHFQQTPLQQVLDKLLDQQVYEYTLLGKDILIKKKGTGTLDNIMAQFRRMEAATDVKGKLVGKDGKPVAGAMVKWKSANIVSTATVTGENGEFVLAGIDPYATLVITGVNIEPLEVALKGETTITITATYKITVLDAVSIQVNTGYQVLSKERATGAFGKPDMEIVRNRTGNMDLLSRLEGQVAGLTISPNTFNSTPNGNTVGTSNRKILLRGVTTVTGSMPTEPLNVLNGVIVTDFSAVNPDDIEDISVLKDAVAAAIWGARAANGVIVVTTRSGRNQRLAVNYQGFVNYTGKPDLSYGNRMNSRQFIQSAKEIFDPVVTPYGSISTAGIPPHEQILYAQSRGLISAAEANQKLDSLASIENIGQIKELFYRPAITHNHTVSASGGNNLYSFYASLGYTGTQTARPGDRNNSYKLNFTQSITSTRLKLTLSAAMINTVSSRNNIPDASGGFLPYQLFRDAAGNNLPINYLTGYSDSLRLRYQALSRINLDYVPLNEVNLTHANNNDLYINITANASVRLWKGLSFSGTYSYQKSPSSTINYTDNKTLAQRKQLLSLTVAPTETSTPVYYLPLTGGSYLTGNGEKRNFTVRNQLVYDASVRHGRDRLTLQAGNDVQEAYTYRTTTQVVGYDEKLNTYATIDNVRLRNGISGTVTGFGSFGYTPFSLNKGLTRFISYFGLASYTLDSRFSIDASWRQDFSNNFGKNLNTQNKPIWSFGGKWRLSQESFMKRLKWVDELGLRVTHGIAGNSPTTSGSLNDIFQSVNAATNTAAIAGDALTQSTVANNALSWEMTRTTNIGIDFSVLNRRLSGSIEAYYKTTTDLLGEIPLNAWTGRTSLNGNIGNLVNKGIELSLRSENIRIKDFSWSSSLVFSYNYNKLVAYSANSPFLNTPSLRISGLFPNVGYNTRPVFAYRFAGLDNLGDPQIYRADKTVTKSPNAAQVEDLAYLGTTQPPFNGGLTNRFAYKGFSLALNMIYNFGALMRRDVNTTYTGRLNAAAFGSPNIQNYFLDRWRKPGDEAFTDIPSFVSSQGTSGTRRNTAYYTQGDINVVSASYIKLRDITLAYELPASAAQLLKMQRASVFVQTTNFMVWKANHDGIDPEFPRSAGSAKPGHGYSMGINLSF